MEINAYLIVEVGLPFASGKKIPLTNAKMLIGRTWEDQKPDIAFDDGHISRRHAEICCKGSGFEICDLPTNRHGTEVNGKLLEKGVPYLLKHNDKIALARGAAVLRFCFKTDPGETQDFEGLLSGEASAKEQNIQSKDLVVEIDRREVILGGKELRPRIVGYEFELIALLYRNRGKAVSHEEIVEWVWRDLPSRETIMHQNVATLVHRLRNYLGDYGKYVINIPAYGYRLD